MRVLFVDDEERVLAGIERTLFMAGRDWEVSFAISGTAALEEMASRPANVVVTDMRMPLMDGAEVLRRVRDGWPAAVRIILSGHTEQESALRTLDVAHQFLAKPCDGTALIESIDRAVRLQNLLRDQTLQNVVGRIDRLPTAPRMYAQLNHLLCDGTADIARIAATIQSDPALAAKVLQLANSAFFRIGRNVSDIRQAVHHLGVNSLRTLVLASEVFSGNAHRDVDGLRLRAARASRLAAMIGKPFASRETVTTAALLADVGLLLPGINALCADADVGRRGFPSYAEVGAYLLGMWGLPTCIVEAVAHHRCPQRIAHGEFDAVGVVHVAVALSKGDEPDEEYLCRLGVLDRLPEWRAARDANESVESES